MNYFPRQEDSKRDKRKYNNENAFDNLKKIFYLNLFFQEQNHDELSVLIIK